jgi:competence protein ComEA
MGPIKNWFGFSRRERRSTFILLIIICIIIAIRYSVPVRNTDINTFTWQNLQSEKSADNSDKSIDSLQQFSFNPNTASYDTLLKLGLQSKTANTLIRYRERGGKFNKPSDIKKVYGINEAQAEKLLPYIELSADSSGKVRKDDYRNKKTEIELNGCDSVSLVNLPGIGPVLASRIIKYRRLLGGYVCVNQLTEVYGLTAETFDRIEGSLTVDTLSVKRIDVNSGGYKELAKIPYLERFEVSSILKYRELKGRINGLGDLTENKLISVEKAGKVRGYMSFE